MVRGGIYTLSYQYTRQACLSKRARPEEIDTGREASRGDREAVQRSRRGKVIQVSRTDA